MYFFLFNRTTLQVFVTYLIGVLSRNLQPPGFSIGRHVFLSGILSVLSGGTVNLLTLVTMNIIFILIPGFDIHIDFSYLWMRP